MKQQELSQTQESLAQDPVSIRIQKAKKDLNTVVLNIQGIYELPTFIMDLIVCSVLSDMREVEMKLMLDNLTTRTVKEEDDQNGDS